MSVINGYYPEDVFRYFEEICAIPHGSGNEKAIADYIERTARQAGLSVYRDSYNNVLVSKCAKAGFEDFPAVLLQGHTDMVCEKDPDSTHDFERDPLKLRLQDGFVSAVGTTLGADDGIAVAMMLAVLTDPTLEHGPVECLFTVDEERGMTGAQNFDYSRISARRVINLDSEAEGECVISCAGGADFTYRFANTYAHNVHPTAKITIGGLAGGHSGADIHLGLHNANACMARFLWEEYQNKPFQLISIDGGARHNVITSECTALISCDHIDRLKQHAADFERELRAHCRPADAGVRVRVDRKGVREQALSFRQSARILSAVLLAPAGVLCQAEDGMPLASSNLGVVRTDEDCVRLEYFFRFNVECYHREYAEKYRILADLLGCELITGGYNACWEKKEHSALARIYQDAFRKLYGGREARLCSMHAGVECGMIRQGLGPEADLISIGPDLFDIHTPRERGDLLSIGRTYGLLLKLIAAR